MLLAVFLILILIGGTLYYLYEKGVFATKEELPIKLTTLFLKPIDVKTQLPIDLRYMLFEGQTVEECLEDSAFAEYKRNETLFFQHFPQLAEKTINPGGC